MENVLDKVVRKLLAHRKKGASGSLTFAVCMFTATTTVTWGLVLIWYIGNFWKYRNFTRRATYCKNHNTWSMCVSEAHSHTHNALKISNETRTVHLFSFKNASCRSCAKLVWLFSFSSLQIPDTRWFQINFKSRNFIICNEICLFMQMKMRAMWNGVLKE